MVCIYLCIWRRILEVHHFEYEETFRCSIPTDITWTLYVKNNMTFNNITQRNTVWTTAYKHLKGQETEPFIQKAVISFPKFHYMDERSAAFTQDILSFPQLHLSNCVVLHELRPRPSFRILSNWLFTVTQPSIVTQFRTIDRFFK